MGHVQNVSQLCLTITEPQYFKQCCKLVLNVAFLTLAGNWKQPKNNNFPALRVMDYNLSQTKGSLNSLSYKNWFKYIL